MFRITVLAATSTVALSATALAGFVVSPVVVQGDATLIGAVTSIDSIDVNSSGQWLVEVDTDFFDTDADGLVLRDGDVVVREGDPLRFPLMGTFGSFDSVRISEDGLVGWNLFIDGLPSGFDSGVFLETTLLVQEGALVGAPEVTPGTPYIGFFEARRNGAGDFLVVASIDDPNIASSVDRALVLLDVIEGQPSPTQSVLSIEGDILPGQTEAVADFGTDGESSAYNDAGEVLFTVDLTGDTAVDTAVYLASAGPFDLLAQEGSPSPVDGRLYTSLVSAKVDLNNGGDWVIRTGINGDTDTNSIIVRNGMVVVQKGDEAPGLPGRMITGFGTGPVRIADDGEVFWYAALDGDAATNQALYKGTTLLAQKGVTEADGLLLTTLGGTTATGGITKGFSISADGRYVIFRGVLASGARGAFLIDTGAGGDPCDLDGNGTVDGADLGILLGNWGGPGLGDLDESGSVDGADLGLLLACWS